MFVGKGIAGGRAANEYRLDFRTAALVAPALDAGRDEGGPDQPDRWPFPSPRSHPPGLCLARQPGAGRPASDRRDPRNRASPPRPPCRRLSPTSFPQRSASASTCATSVSASTSSRPGLAKCPIFRSPSSERECSRPDGRCNTEALASSRKATAPRPNERVAEGHEPVGASWSSAPGVAGLRGLPPRRLAGHRLGSTGLPSRPGLPLGARVWDPGWYGGTYPLNYSLVYPLVAGYLGLWAVAALSAAGAAFCFDRSDLPALR